MMNLANAYRNRIRGDRAQNLEEAIAAYQAALTVTTQTAMPVEWAMTMINLANAYQTRIRGDRAQNLEDAIAAYRAALTVRTQTAMPVEWATTMMNLAAAYADRIRGDRAQNLEDAVAAYQAALTVMTQTAMPIDWAMTMNNLAVAYADRIQGDRAQNLEDAVAAYQAALTVFTQTAMPVDWATAMMNLAIAYRNRIRGDRAQNVEDAIAAYQAALTVRTREAMPVDHRDTLRNLVILYFGERHWAEAYQTCLDAIAVGADIFAVAVGDAGRMNAIKQTGNLYTRAAYSAVQLGRYGEALTQLEAGKARLLAEAQSLGDANLTQLDDAERGRLRALRDQIKGLEYEARLPADNPARRDDRAISDDLREARAALRGLIDAFRVAYPDFMPEGLALDALLASIPADGALVAPLFTPQGSAVFIVPGGTREVTADHMLLLDDFKLEDLGAITRGTEDAPGWLRYYVEYRFNRAGIRSLFDAIDDVTRRLWEAFVGRIHAHLHAIGVQRALLMPQGDTALVPLHAAWREVDGARRYFIDDIAITYTPSMATLATARRKSTRGEGALVVGVSDYRTMGDLPNTRAEAESIAALFNTEPLLNSAASVAAVKTGATGKAYVHLSCHGGFGWGGDAFASALYLGDEEPLPLPQIMAGLDLDAAALVVLSACETGIVDFDNVPDEFVGLPAGFMQAGASAVVSSLWTVEDRSTALLMERMYNNMRGENPMQPAQALREAQFWLRDATAGEIGDYYQQVLAPRMSQSDAGNAFVEIVRRAATHEKPYAHPFYWAAFAYNGL
jgi:CHAT domain-containing protein